MVNEILPQKYETGPQKIHDLKLELFTEMCTGGVRAGGKFDCFDPGGPTEDDYFELRDLFSIAKKYMVDKEH